MSEVWREKAACFDPSGQGIYLQYFFPETFLRKGERQALEDIAKEMCRICDVRQECLEYALQHERTSDGVWGGLNRTERAQLSSSKKIS